MAGVPRRGAGDPEGALALQWRRVKARWDPELLSPVPAFQDGCVARGSRGCGDGLDKGQVSGCASRTPDQQVYVSM